LPQGLDWHVRLATHPASIKAYDPPGPAGHLYRYLTTTTNHPFGLASDNSVVRRGSHGPSPEMNPRCINDRPQRWWLASCGGRTRRRKLAGPPTAEQPPALAQRHLIAGVRRDAGRLVSADRPSGLRTPGRSRIPARQDHCSCADRCPALGRWPASTDRRRAAYIGRRRPTCRRHRLPNRRSTRSEPLR
jgi:hypothetical protein